MKSVFVYRTCRTGCRKKGIHSRDTAAIRRILQQEWKLQPSDNSNSYLQYRLATDGTIYEFMQKGRFYNIKKNEVLDKEEGLHLEITET